MSTPTPRPVTAADRQPTPTTQQRPTPPGPPPQQAKRSRLGGIQRGRLKTALRYLFYAPEGIGKSTLAADAPNPLFLDIEGGSLELNVSRYPFYDGPGGHVPKSYADVLGAIDDLISNPKHGYETVVVDTLDVLEQMIHAHICRANQKPNIESFGYGKGYKVAATEYRVFQSRLEALQAQGIAVIQLAHSMVKTYKNPEGPDYDRYQLCTHELISAQAKGWSDVVGFLRFDGGASKLLDDTSQTPRPRGWSTGKRLVHLAREAAWDAKCRLSMPAEIELGVAHPWQPFAEARDTARDSTAESLIADVLVEIDRITGGDRSIGFTTAAGRATSFAELNAMFATSDADSLTRILAGLKATTASTVTQES